ncbi:hypothetical protein F4808DRAFT_465386 [Astrocystis sublimbata]|nr:hypothetical protein F4808DRAFT_465386 [Astrocystis sublimbata]
MSTSIPYDPSLPLMSVVNEAALNNVMAMAEIQAPVDAARDRLDSLTSSKQGLTTTMTELKSLGVGTEALDEELKKLNVAVERAAADYAAAKISLGDLRSEIKTMRLATDTLTWMCNKNFSSDSNPQTLSTYSGQIAAYVSGTASTFLGTEASMEAGNAALHQVNKLCIELTQVYHLGHSCALLCQLRVN